LVYLSLIWWGSFPAISRFFFSSLRTRLASVHQQTTHFVMV
jgi:hypothetical protein